MEVRSTSAILVLALDHAMSCFFSDLQVRESRTGLGGKTLLTLGPAVPGKEELPAHTLTPGDIVALEERGGGDGQALASGVVTRASAAAITVAFDADADVPGTIDAATGAERSMINSRTFFPGKWTIRTKEDVSVPN